jgi:hypothetical protein
MKNAAPSWAISSVDCNLLWDDLKNAEHAEKAEHAEDSRMIIRHFRAFRHFRVFRVFHKLSDSSSRNISKH